MGLSLALKQARSRRTAGEAISHRSFLGGVFRLATSVIVFFRECSNGDFLEQDADPACRLVRDDARWSEPVV